MMLCFALYEDMSKNVTFIERLKIVDLTVCDWGIGTPTASITLIYTTAICPLES